MQKTPLKAKATKGVIWNAVEKLSVQAGQLVIGIILARILMPEDFGLIGMLSIFIAVSGVFVTSGMGSGLIQKKERTELDFSTVFVFNFIVSSSIYFLLFITAPLIAGFYNMPQLETLTRVLTINIILNSLAIVQRTRLTINLDFKAIAKVNVVSVVSGGSVGVAFAYLGFGVWALVIENLTRSTIAVVMLWSLSRWKPSLLFSKDSFRALFGFGSKLLISSLLAEIVRNIYNISIGKVYSASELGFYTRAKIFAELTAGTVTNVLQQVTFPILASLQDDREKMISVFSRLIRMSAFLIFPAMTLLALLAEPFIRVVLTDKWLPVVPLLQFMCFARIFYPISAMNLNIVNAIGRSDLYLKAELAKIPITIITLLITIPIGVKAIVIGHVVNSFIGFFINAYIPSKLFDYGPLAQLKQMVPVFIMTIITAAVVYMVTSNIDSLILKLVFGIISGLGTYIFISYLFKVQELKEVQILVRNLITKRRKRLN